MSYQEGFMYCSDSFLKGYKPAVLMNPKSDDKEDIKMLSSYPFVEDIQVFDLEGQILYFQNEKLKQDFLDRYQYINDPHSAKYHRLLGLTLGFPPKAVDFYVSELMFPDEHRERRIGLGYCGIECISSVGDLIENVTYLWDQINNSDETTDIWYKPSKTEFITFEVTYTDYKKLNQVSDEIKKSAG